MNYHNCGLLICIFLFFLGLFLVQFEFEPEIEGLVFQLEKRNYEYIDSISIAIDPINRIKAISFITNLRELDSVSFQFHVPEKVESLNNNPELELTYINTSTRITLTHKRNSTSKKKVFTASLKFVDDKTPIEYGKYSLNVGGSALRKRSFHKIPVSLSINLPYKSEVFYENKMPNEISGHSRIWYNLGKDDMASAVEYFSPENKKWTQKIHTLGNVLWSLSLSFCINWVFFYRPRKSQKTTVIEKEDNTFEVTFVDDD